MGRGSVGDSLVMGVVLRVRARRIADETESY